MDKGRPWEPVVRAYVDRINGVIRERLTTFRRTCAGRAGSTDSGRADPGRRRKGSNSSSKRWRPAASASGRTSSIELAPARLIESRARGAGQPASQQRQAALDDRRRRRIRARRDSQRQWPARGQRRDGSPPHSSAKLRNIRRPSAWLFSGWNCVANKLSPPDHRAEWPAVVGLGGDHAGSCGTT